MPTFPMLLGYDTVRADRALPDILASHTCPNDGYVFAWQDIANPDLVWMLPACPVDAVAAALKAALPGFVTNGYNATDKTSDPYNRVMEIIAGATGDANGWLSNHATPSVAAFLSNEAQLHALIFTELKNQGIVQ